MSEKTIFKRIIDGEIPAEVIHDDEHCLAFKDVDPKAPTHVLVIPKREIAALSDLTPDDAPLMGHLMLVATQVATKLGLTDGYRVVINCGQDGGQSVFHIHLHLMGGRQMKWPPG